MATAGTDGGLGVYVHFPFCRSICPYCDFAVEAPREIPQARYAAAVAAELSRRAEEFALHGPVRSIFFGGGTPSLWAPAGIATVLCAIERAIGRPSGIEVTLEANPEDHAPEILRALLDLGVNRISWGVQSFQPAVLKSLGRGRRSRGAPVAIETSLALGFPSVAVDLMYGAAGEEADTAANDARRAAALGVHHVSAYALTLDELVVETPLARAARDGRYAAPDADAQAEQGHALRVALAERGFARYEISNFARSGAFSVHNLGYWEGRPYLGLGPGASGATRSRRYENGRSVAAYLASVEAGGLPPGTSEPLDEATRWTERVFLGLRLCRGIDLEALAREFGRGRVDGLRATAASLGGLVILDGPRLFLTERGLDLHTEIAARLG